MGLIRKVGFPKLNAENYVQRSSAREQEREKWSFKVKNAFRRRFTVLSIRGLETTL